MVSSSAFSAMLRWSPMMMLALGPVLGVAQDPTAADYFVRDLPGVPKDAPPVKMHAGHIEITPEHNGNLFFWHFQNRQIIDRPRTVVWLNGGPGCSSEDGALLEIGPFRVKDDQTLTMNGGSWNEFANLLFVDNPVGTGYSYVDTNSMIHDLDTMANNFITFLEKFFALFPEYEQDDLYFAGESYAGQYIPYIAKAILEHNKQKPYAVWNLKGLLIGNGWMAPKQQYNSYLDLMFENSLLQQGSNEVKQLQQDVDRCNSVIAASPGRVDYGECEAIVSNMLRMLKKGNGDDACVNMYDVRLRDKYPSCGMSWPEGLDAVTSYLRTKEVTTALHVNEQKSTGWQECNGKVGQAFTAAGSVPSVELLPDILKQIPVLLFSGDKDLLCNHFGTENMISDLTWNGAKGFGGDAARKAWTFDGDDAGYWQEDRNLTYVLFRESSHMVPVDFPNRSRDMLDRFLGINPRNMGVDPFDSQLDGEEDTAPVSDGGPPVNTAPPSSQGPSQEETQKQLDDAKWAAYENAGGAVLIIILIILAVWGIAMWRQRRKTPAYQALSAEEASSGTSRHRRGGPGDLEAAAFDESELDDLHVDTPTAAGHSKYSVGEDSEDEEVPTSSKEKARGS